MPYMPIGKPSANSKCIHERVRACRPHAKLFQAITPTSYERNLTMSSQSSKANKSGHRPKTTRPRASGGSVEAFAPSLPNN